MKAFQFVEWQKPAELREVPVPEPGPGQVLVKVGGAGACHSDLHLMDAPPDGRQAKLPFTIGHENAGWVEKLGGRQLARRAGAPQRLPLARGQPRPRAHPRRAWAPHTALRLRGGAGARRGRLGRDHAALALHHQGALTSRRGAPHLRRGNSGLDGAALECLRARDSDGPPCEELRARRPGAGGTCRSLRYLVCRGRSGDSGLPFLEHLS